MGFGVMERRRRRRGGRGWRWMEERDGKLGGSEGRRDLPHSSTRS